MREQWAGNDVLIRESKDIQRRLRDDRQAKEKSAQAPAAPGKKEQAFIDAANFLENGWQFNVKAAAPGEGPPPAAGAFSLDAVLDGAAFRGLNGAVLAPAAGGPEVSMPAAVDAAKGLKEIGESAAGEVPAAAPPGDVRGCDSYTFLRSGGDGEISISFTRRDAIPRLGAALALLAAIGIIIARRFLGR
jgi:hypothetical protein